jgi:SNF2 family DNA or RNA helicase
LEARSRWCLTGTPIQNRLEDIGSLFAFLRANPFHSLQQFRKFISVPFEQGDAVVIDRLINLYDSLVLRRTKDILLLPGQVERIRELKLSEGERRQYKSTMNILNRHIRQLVGVHEVESKFGLFQAHLQLRILCNHGTYQKLFSWKKRSLDEEQEALVSEFGLNSEATCEGCRQPRPILGFGRTKNDFVEKCAHVLCADCLDDCGGLQGSEALKHCPLCRFNKVIQDAEASSSQVVDSGGDVAMEDPGEDRYFNDVGHSTKMDALVKDVKENLESTKRSPAPGETPSHPNGNLLTVCIAASFSPAGPEPLTLSGDT